MESKREPPSQGAPFPCWTQKRDEHGVHACGTQRAGGRQFSPGLQAGLSTTQRAGFSRCICKCKWNWCWFSTGNEGTLPISHPLWFPLRESPSSSFPTPGTVIPQQQGKEILAYASADPLNSLSLRGWRVHLRSGVATPVAVPCRQEPEQAAKRLAGYSYEHFAKGC